MDLEELRIGNNVSGKDVGEVIVRQNLGYRIIARNGHIDFTFDSIDISPIVLTEEWLEKFDQSKPHIIQRIINEIDESYFEVEIFIGGKYFNLKTYCELQYVHQLQNIYYALTGTELTYGNKS